MDELTEAERLGCDPREIVEWPWTTASPGRYVRTETVARIKADAHAAGVTEGQALRQRIEALAAGWESWGGHASQECAAMLRDALADTSPQGEGCSEDGCADHRGDGAMRGLTEKAARPGDLPDDPTPWADTPFLTAPSGVERALAVCSQVEANPVGWGGDMAVSLARTIRAVLAGTSPTGSTSTASTPVAAEPAEQHQPKSRESGTTASDTGLHN